MKWFCDYDVASQPRLLGFVLNSDFGSLTALAGSVLLAGCLLERTSIGLAISRALNRITSPVQANADVLLRAFCAFFLISLWTVGGIILTPELKTSSPLIPLLQLGMAAALVWKRSSVFAGFGIVALYGLALSQYGLFHLLDYPIFLGVAVYLAARGCSKETLFGVRAIDVLRWAAGITLMWASIEKWAYPEWTLPIYLGHPSMSMGFDFEFFMQAAGVIEFTLAFALLWTPLVRRSAALILTGMFISATFEFGKVDAIGHSVIIAVLLMVAADDLPVRGTWRPWRALAASSVSYGLALLVIMSAYYGMHAILVGTAVI